MAIAALATETKATALIAECRRCLNLGVDLKAYYIKHVLDQLESATVNDLSGRTNVTPSSALDGRDAGETATVAL